MDTLKEYLKIKQMSTKEEITDYISTSMDFSSFRSFLRDLLDYCSILQIIADERHKEWCIEYDKLMTEIKSKSLNRDSEKNAKPRIVENNSAEKVSGEARVIWLFPKYPKKGA